MLDMQATLDLLTQTAEVLRRHVPAERWPSAGFVGVAGTLAGLVLAFWGARLLRTGFVLGFLIVGAAVGIHYARYFGVDDLFGLVLGGGLAALLGYLAFRWWVGVTTGLCAAMVVAAFAVPRFLPDAGARIAERQQAAAEERVAGIASAENPNQALVDALLAAFADVRDVIWTEHYSGAVRMAGLLAAAWVLGTLLGTVFPRLMTVLGTSITGTGLLAAGVGTLLFAYWPAAWQAVRGHPGWCLAGCALVLLASFGHQYRRPRAAPPPAPPSEPAKG